VHDCAASAGSDPLKKLSAMAITIDLDISPSPHLPTVIIAATYTTDFFGSELVPRLVSVATVSPRMPHVAPAVAVDSFFGAGPRGVALGASSRIAPP